MSRLRPRPSPLGELHYAAEESWLGLWLVPAGIGMAVWALVLTWKEGPLDPPIHWIIAGFGAVLVVIGLLTAPRRYELVLLLGQGRYRYTAGLRWSPRESEGDFTEIEAVRLTRVTHDREGSKLSPPYYLVSLIRPNREASELVVASSTDRAWAWAEARKIALALGRALDDASFGSNRQWTVEQLRVDKMLKSDPTGGDSAR